MKIPFYSLSTELAQNKTGLLSKIEKVIDQGNFILGKEVKCFEQEFAKYIGCKYALGVSNGYDALFLSLKVLNIGTGDQVIVPAHTFIATILAILRTGATPILADVKKDDMTIDIRSICRALTKRTKAIIPVHIYGIPCEMQQISEFATKHQIHIVEDFAQSHGTLYNGQKVGSFGICNATSFYPTKTLGALGDGGAITTNDKTLYTKLLKLRNYGSKEKYIHDIFGYNHRLDEIQAAILRYNLLNLETKINKRAIIVEYYFKHLEQIPNLTLPPKASSKRISWHLFVIRVNNREGLQKYLTEKGVQTLIHYPVPIYSQPLLKAQFSENIFHNTEEITSTCLSLPLYDSLTEKEIQYIAKCITKYFTQIVT